MMGITNLEVFNSCNITKKNKKLRLFSAGFYDDIATNNWMEYLIAAKTENKENTKFENEIKIKKHLFIFYLFLIDFSWKKFNQTIKKSF